jgi:hypothetical protein
MADARYGGYLSADFELLGGVVDGMDIEDLSQDELATFLDARMMARNAAVNLILGEISLPTTARGALLGQESAMPDWSPGTELSRGQRVKTSGLDAVGFPVTKFGPVRSGWTRDYVAKATNREIVRHMDSVMQAHMQTNWKEALRAIFNNVEWTWTHDMFPEDGSLKVKPLLNADGYVSPEWMSYSFDGTENHYLALGAGTLDEADLQTMADELRKHGYGVSAAAGGMGGRLEIWINSAQVANVQAHTNFVASNDPIVVDMNKIAVALDQDTHLGYNSAARCYIRQVDYIPAGYCMMFATNSDANGQQISRVNSFAPLRRRIPTTASLQGIQRINESQYPLQESFWEDWFGFGAYARGSAIVGQLAGSYTIPTI